MASYKLLCRGSLTGGDVDLELVLKTYNFGFWFDGVKSFLQLDEEGETVAIVSIDGEYTVYSVKNIGCGKMRNKIEWILGLKEDLRSFYSIARNDPLLGDFASKYTGWRIRSTSLWWGLVIGVCQQNASFRQGWTTLYNIVKNYDKKIRLDGYETYLAPSPRDILEDPGLLEASRTGYRSKTIINVARWYTGNEGIVSRIEEMKPEEAEHVLTSIKGIGSYTARTALVLGLREYELPPIDRWMKKIIQIVYGAKIGEEEKTWINRWGRYSGLAVLAVTIALDAEPLAKALKRIREKTLTPMLTDKPSPLTLWMYTR